MSQFRHDGALFLINRTICDLLAEKPESAEIDTDLDFESNLKNQLKNQLEKSFDGKIIKIADFKTPYDEFDFQKIFIEAIECHCPAINSFALPVNLIVRGLPGSGKTYLSDFSASNILNCLSIDIDKFQFRGIGERSHLMPRTDHMDIGIMFQLIDACRYMMVNTVVSGVFSKISDVYQITNNVGYNFVFEFYSDFDSSCKENVNEVSKKMLKWYADNFEPLAKCVR